MPTNGATDVSPNETSTQPCSPPPKTSHQPASDAKPNSSLSSASDTVACSRSTITSSPSLQSLPCSSQQASPSSSRPGETRPAATRSSSSSRATPRNQPSLSAPTP